jgi:hypothetical protein
MPVTEEKKTKTVVSPFGIEANNRQCCDLAIQSIAGCKLRGRLRSNPRVADSKTGEESTPIDASRHLAVLGMEIPGMELHVNPAKRTYRIQDPLHGDEELGRRIYRALERDERPMTIGDRDRKIVEGVPPQDGTLNEDEMKTLCREMLRFLEADLATMARGPRPSMKEIDALPGDYILNPNSSEGACQPQYEKDLEPWRKKLSTLG